MSASIGLVVVALLACFGGAGVAGCDASDDCTDEYIVVPITVVDADGARVAGATVTATNEATGATAGGTTGSDGMTYAIGELLGPGTSVVTATLGERSASAAVEWRCGTCHCAPRPATLTLAL
jgi:hypothetical protein